MARSKQREGMDAIELLTEDHKRVQKLFKEFEKLDDDAEDEKEALARRICSELTIHAAIEEEIFYPAAREAIEEDDLMDEAVVEHASAKDLVAQLEDMSAGDELFDAKVTVLGEYVNHHVEEEQKKMFPKAKKAKMDLEGLGAQLLARKQELMVEMGLGEEGAEEGQVRVLPKMKPTTRKSAAQKH